MEYIVIAPEGLRDLINATVPQDRLGLLRIRAEGGRVIISIVNTVSELNNPAGTETQEPVVVDIPIAELEDRPILIQRLGRLNRAAKRPDRDIPVVYADAEEDLVTTIHQMRDEDLDRLGNW